LIYESEINKAQIKQYNYRDREAMRFFTLFQKREHTHLVPLRHSHVKNRRNKINMQDLEQFAILYFNVNIVINPCA